MNYIVVVVVAIIQTSITRRGQEWKKEK